MKIEMEMEMVGEEWRQRRRGKVNDGGSDGGGDGGGMVMIGSG